MTEGGGEAVLFLASGEIRALVLAADACVGVAASGSPEHVGADVRLRGVLQVARDRLAGALDRDPWFYLDPSEWPDGVEVPVFLGRDDVAAIRRGAEALFDRDPGAEAAHGGRFARLLRSASGQLGLSCGRWWS